MVAHAAAHQQTLEVVAGGSKRRLGRPAACDAVLDVSALSGIIDYDPAELVLTAHAATPMDEIESLLAGERQMLAFEPPDSRASMSGEGTPTLGGVVACNLAGPRRVRAGGARDHLLGFAAINGRGEAWRSGGRVVKNVTGYDLCKLQAGAYGTLSVLTELSVRVVPRPEESCTVVLHDLTDPDAVAAMARALNSPHEVSAAAHMPSDVAARSAITAVSAASRAVTLLRLEGPAPSVAYRFDMLRRMFGQAERLDSADTRLLWTQISAAPRLLPGDRVVWRVSPTPSAAAAFVQGVADRVPLRAAYDWGGGLVWLALRSTLAGHDAGAAIVRGALSRFGGHAMLFEAPDTVRAAVPVFDPEPAPLAALSDRVKTSFDPHRILNPGRMQKGR